MLFDPLTLHSHRKRAQPIFDTRLFEYVATQLYDRIDPLRVTFDKVLDVTPFHTGGLFSAFQERFIQSQWLSSSSSPASLALLPHSSFDLIVSALDLHWINDVPRFLTQVFQLLKPGGLFLCSFWAGETLKELRHALFHAENIAYSRAAARLIPMITLEEGVRLIQSTGFTLPVGDHETLTVLYPSLKRCVDHLRAMGERNALKERHFFSRSLLASTETFYTEHYGTAENELPATFQLVTLTGWTPGPGQPCPLKPGQASHSLHDALK